MIGTKIKNYLNENGIKQTFLVDKTGLSASQISDICNHDRKVDAVEYYRICKALNLELEYFFKDSIGSERT